MIPIRQGGGVRIALLASLALLVTGLALALAGCGDDDDENPIKPPGGPSPAPDTPRNALSMYVAAYEARDTFQVMALYDSTYAGSSMDLNSLDPPILFTYEDEAQHMRSLGETPGLSVDLALGPQVSWLQTASDDPSHPEWAVIQISGSAFQLQITDGPTTHEAGGQAGTFQEFTFNPRLDSTSQTDTLWRIVRWREVGSSAPGP